MSSQPGPRAPLQLKRMYFIVGGFVLALFVVGFVSYRVGFQNGYSSAERLFAFGRSSVPVPSTSSTHLSQGLRAAISKCVSVCKSTLAMGVSLANGACVGPTPDQFDGYVCAVVVHGAGHCAAYLSDNSPEIVLTPKCTYVGVYSKGGK